MAKLRLKQPVHKSAWDVSPVMLLAFIGVAAVVGFLCGLLVPRLQFSKSVLVLGF